MADEMIGERVRYWRKRRGWSQERLAETIGRSRRWVNRVECGAATVELRSDLQNFADALGVSVTYLTGQPAHPQTDVERATVTMIPQLRAALLDDPIESRHVTVEQVTADVGTVMTARMACDYTTLAAVLPRALAEARILADADPGAGYPLIVRAAAFASLAVRPMGYVDLSLSLAQAADAAALAFRGMPERGAAAYCLAQHAISAGTPGGPRRSFVLAERAADLIGDGGDDPDALTWYGMLRLQSALSAAMLGHPDDVDERLAEAEHTAKRVTGDPWRMEFSTANVGVWGVNCAVEAGQYDRVARLARRVPRYRLRTRQRLAHLHIGTARAHAQLGRPDAATASLMEALRAAPAELRVLVPARETVGQLVRFGGRNGSPHLAELAEAVGVDPLLRTEDD